jgi:hypothetical protein
MTTTNGPGGGSLPLPQPGGGNSGGAGNSNTSNSNTGNAGNAGNTGNTDTSATSTNPNAPPGLPGIPIKDYAGGPFIGVRPSAHGKSLLTLFGADTYETWIYTTVDYDQEKSGRLAAAATVFH